MPESILALDVGTTAAKCVAFTTSGRVLASVSRGYPLDIGHGGSRTQDPERVWDACVAALSEVVDATRGVQPIALALSTALHALIGADADGTARTPILTWADDRAERQARALTGTPLGIALHEETGTPVHPMSPLVKLRWFGEALPTFAPHWWWGLKEFLVWRLTGTVATDVSSASASGLMTTRTGVWSPLALDAAGIDAARLAPIRACEDTAALHASVATRVGLPVGLPVVLGGGDGPLASLGSGAIGAQDIGISLGTSGAVRRVVHAPGVGADHTRFCFALGHGTWVVGRAQSNGSSALRWAARTFAPELTTPDGEVNDVAVLERIADVPDGSDGLVFQPFVLPERTPRWERGQEAHIEHLRAEHTSAHLLRATMEGVIDGLVEMIRDLAADVQAPTYAATGGAFRGALWRTMLVERLSAAVQFSTDTEGTARGAAMIATISVGLARDLEDAARRLAPQEHRADGRGETP